MSQRSDYFAATENRRIRDDLVFAVANVAEPKVAVDCGCGAGADIHYLAENGFVVHGFDVEEEAIARCQARFRHRDNVHVSRSSFGRYTFPRASLVVADASLFFCPKAEFPAVWKNICECLHPQGIFCGSFLGPEDTMASPAYNAADFWPVTAVFEEQEVLALFAGFEILRFKVHQYSGTTPSGQPHDWHIFAVVAKKAARHPRANRLPDALAFHR